MGGVRRLMSSTAPPTPADFLGDPLSDVSRRERRSLLASSTIAVLTAHAGLIPKQISALGIELTSLDRSAFLILFAAVVIYFLVAFAVYGFSAFLVWRHKYHQYQEKAEIAAQNWTQNDQHDYDELRRYVPAIAWLYRISKAAAYFRIAFEFPLPVLIGLYAIYALLSRA
jgi:hypothetical protein